MKRYEIIFKESCSDLLINKILNKTSNKVFLKEIYVAYADITHQSFLKIIHCFGDYIDISPIKKLKLEFRNKQNIKLNELKELKVNLMSKQWDIDKITNNRKSYQLHQPTKNISIGIIDSGIDNNHIDLYPSMLESSKNFVVDSNDTSSIEYNENVKDSIGHGTAVAGQIAANGIIKGVAPGIGFRVYKIFDHQFSSTELVIKAIIAAVKDGNNVVNLSIGQYLMIGKERELFLSYKRAVNYAYINNSIIVSSLGNDGVNIDNQEELKQLLKKKMKYSNNDTIIDCPNNFKNVISVGSISSLGKITHYSNYTKNINNFFLTYGGDDETINKSGMAFFLEKKLFIKEWVISTSLNNDYFYFYGNSFSTPKVAATIALIIDKYKIYKEPYLAIEHLTQTSNRCSFGLILNTYNSLKPKKLQRSKF